MYNSLICQKLEKIIRIALWLLTLLTIGVQLAASSFALYSGDEFSYALDTMGADHRIGDLLVLSFRKMYKNYIVWEGTYAEEFLSGFFNPYEGFGFVQIRILIWFNFAFFLMTLYVFLRKSVQLCGGENRSVLTDMFFCGTVLCLFSSASYHDIYYQWTSNFAYLLFTGIFLRGMMCTYRGSRTGNRGLFVLAILCMGIMAGATTAIGGTACWILLVFNLYLLLRDHRVHRGPLLVFVSAVGFVLINVIAPGNYARQSATVADAAQTSLEDKLILGVLGDQHAVRVEGRWLLTQTVFLVFFLAALAAGLIAGRTRFRLKRAFLLLAGSAAPFVTAFPVVLGYQEYLNLPSRCLFLIRLELMIILMADAYYAGSFVRGLVCDLFGRSVENSGRAFPGAGIPLQKEVTQDAEKPLIVDAPAAESLNTEKPAGKARRGMTAVVCAACVLIPLAVPGVRHALNPANSVTYITAKGLVSGEIPRRYERMRAIYEYIFTTDDDPVLIADWPDNLPYYYCNDLSTAEDDWVNGALMQLLDKDMIRLLKPEETDLATWRWGS